jgi:hypothetical protein
MNPFPQILHTRLDAEMVDATYDDLLFAVYILHAADAWAAAREAPETLTLDALYRVAWWLGIDLQVEMMPRSEPPSAPMAVQ